MSSFCAGFRFKDDLMSEAWISSGIRWVSVGAFEVVLECLWIWARLDSISASTLHLNSWEWSFLIDHHHLFIQSHHGPWSWQQPEHIEKVSAIVMIGEIWPFSEGLGKWKRKVITTHSISQQHAPLHIVMTSGVSLTKSSRLCILFKKKRQARTVTLTRTSWEEKPVGSTWATCKFVIHC